MVKKQIPILYVMAVLLLTGCVTAKKKAAPAVTPKKEAVVKESVVVKESIIAPAKETVQGKNKITKDVQVFKDLQEIDLDGDGVKEIIAIYSISENSGGVKVIKTSNDKIENILFKRTFSTPNIKLELKKGTPFIVVKEKEYLFGLGLNKIYRWDGKTFVAEGK
jgi:hypothetical protein